MSSEHPLDITFRLLAADGGPSARHCLRKALEEDSPPMQQRAFATAMTLRTRAAHEAVVSAYHLLPRQIQLEAIGRSEELLGVLRSLLNHSSVQMRRNAVEILAEACRTKLTYLYVHALNDDDDIVAATARDALVMVTADYHLAASAARRGVIQIGRDELASRKYSILDPLSTALKTPGQKNLDVLVEVAMGLDASLDAMLMRLLAEPNDRRTRALLELLWSGTSTRVVGFVVDLLKKTRLARVGLRIIARRIDARFVRMLLESPELTEPEVAAALERLKPPHWLDPRHGVLTTLTARQALAAMRLVVLGDIEPEEKTRFIRALADGRDKGVTSMASQAQRMLAGAVATRAVAEEIALYADRHYPHEIVDHLGQAPVPLGDSGEVEPADPDNARILEQVRRQRVSFRDFMTSFDRLNPTLRRRAAGLLAERDPNFPLKILSELASDRSDQRMRGLKMVEMLDLVIDYRDQVKTMLADLDDRIRATAARLSGRLKEADATRALLRMVMDHDHRVCANAIEALADAGTPGMEELLRLLAGHSDNRIRANAIVALRRAARQNVDGLLREMLRHTRTDMRVSALWAVEEIAGTGVADEVLAMSRSDPDPEVRDRARDTLRKLKAKRTKTVG